MKKRHPLCLLKQLLALALCVVLTVPSSVVSAVAAETRSHPQSGAQAWRSFLAGGAAPAFLAPFRLEPARLDDFAQVMGRTTLAPQALGALDAERGAAMMRAAVAGYADELIARVDALSTQSETASLQALRGELESAAVVAAIDPSRAPSLERGRRVLGALIERRQEAAVGEIAQVHALWAKPDPGLTAQTAAAAGAKLSLRLGRPTARAARDPASAAVPVPLGQAASPAFHAVAAPTRENLSPESLENLRSLGLSYTRLQELTQAQVAYQTRVLEENPSLRQAIFSLRPQQRFSRAVLALTARLRAAGSPHPLAQALELAAKNYYADNLPASAAQESAAALAAFSTFLPAHAQPSGVLRLEQQLLGAPVGDGEMERRVARALLMPDPVLFKETTPGSDAEFMATLRRQSWGMGAELTVLWGHPFTEKRQLIGHPVPEKGRDRLVAGYGELMRQVESARRELEAARKAGREPKRVLLLIKNVEALEPGVRILLQEAMDAQRLSELVHPELGKVPANLQFLFTIGGSANLEDDSFYDRVVVKELPEPARPFTPLEALSRRQMATADQYRSLSVRREKGRPILTLPGVEIALSAEFSEIDNENLHDMIYLKTGLVLDLETVRMLTAMEETRRRGLPILRVEGPTGLGKTFTAQGYARLTGRGFFSNPVNSDTDISGWIGGFEQDGKGLFRFDGETPLKRLLEEGGVVALSELNTLLDHHKTASLAWWLAQIAETPPEADGSRIVRLTEVPVAAGEAAPVIRIHRDALIIVDTNPESGYSARGRMPAIFSEHTPSLEVSPLIGSGASALPWEEQIQRLALYTDMFLKHDWVEGGQVLAQGIKDPGPRAILAQRLAETYKRAAGQIKAEGGRVLSTRELKRMSQDALKALQDGLSQEEALGEAAYLHLAAALEPSERDEVLEVLTQTLDLTVEAMDLPRLLSDQLLVKKRPVHVRVPAQSDGRLELERWAAAQPGLELAVINVTDETDRFQLEGGLVPAPGGEGLEFGAGMLARMIEKARAQPEKKVVYVFDNAHNLRPEQIVALNEFLQEGRLYPKGAPGELRLPANAAILFISRSDSPLLWSPAERSRFVEVAWSRKAASARPMGEEMLRQMLAEVADSVSAQLGSWVSDVFLKLTEEMRGKPGMAASQRRYRRLVEAVGQAALEAAREGEGLAPLTARLENILRDVVLMAFPAAAQENLKRRLFRSWDVFTQAHEGLSLLSEKSDEAAQPENELARAKLDFQRGWKPGERKTALARIAGLVKGPEISWEREKKEELKELDVAEAIVFSHSLDRAGTVSSLAVSQDGRSLLTASRDGKARIFERQADGSWGQEPVWTSLDYRVKLVAFSPDGRSILIGGGRDGESRLFEKAANGKWGKKPAWTSVMKEALSMSFSPDGRSFLIADGQTQLFEKSANGKWGQKPIWTSPPGDWTRSAVFSPDGRSFLVGFHSGGEARLFEMPARGRWPRQLVWTRIGQPSYITGLDQTVVSAAFSPDGGSIVLVGADGKARMFEKRADRSWSEEYSWISKGHGKGPMAFSLDGRSLLSRNADGGVVLFEKQADGKWSPKPVWMPESDEFDANGVAFSPDGRGIFIAGRAGVSVYAIRRFIVADERAGLFLDSGREIKLADLPETVRVVSAPPRPWPETLAQAKIDFSRARSEERKAGARAVLRKALDTPAIPWQAAPREELKDLDVARVMAFSQNMREDGGTASAAVSPDGRFLLAGTPFRARILEKKADGTWSEKEAWSRRMEQQIDSMAFSPDGRFFLIGTHNGQLLLFQKYVDGTWSQNPIWTSKAYGLGKTTIAFSPDGTSFLAGFENGWVRLFEKQASGEWGGPAWRPEDQAGATPLFVSFGPEGRSFLVGGGTGQVWMFQKAANGTWSQPIWQHGFRDYISFVAFSPDGRSLFTITSHSKIHSGELFEKKPNGTWKLALSFPVEEKISSAGFSPDGRSFLVIGRREQARLYEKQGDGTWRQEQIWKVDHPGDYVAFSPDSREILTGDPFGISVHKIQELIVTDEQTAVFLGSGRKARLADLPERVKTVASPRKPWPQALAQAQLEFGRAGSEKEKGAARAELQDVLDTPGIPWQASGREELKELDVARASVSQTLDSGRATSSFAVSPDGRYLLTGGGNARLFERQDDGTWGHNPVWTSSRRRASARLGLLTMSVAFSPDSRSFLISGSDGYMRLFERNPGGRWGQEPIWTSEYNEDGASGIQFSPNGRSFLTTAFDGPILLFERQGDGGWLEKAAWKMAAAAEDYATAAFSPDGWSVLAGTIGGRTAWFKKQTDGTWGQKPEAEAQGVGVLDIAFSRDGLYFVTNGKDHRVRMFKKQAGGTWEREPLWISKIQEGGSHSAAFASDGRSLVVGGGDKKVRLFTQVGDNWGLEPAWTSAAHAQRVIAAEFSPDGQAIIVGTSNGISIYDTRELNAPLIVADEQTGVLLGSGRKVRLADLPERVETVVQARKPWPQALAQAQLEFGRAGSEKEKAAARAKLQDVLKTRAIPWQPAAREELAELDVARTRAVSQVLDGIGSVFSIAADPSGRYLLTGSDDDKARIFEKSADGTWSQDFRWAPTVHKGLVGSVVFGPDGLSVLTGSSDGKARLFMRRADGTWGEKPAWTSAAYGSWITSAVFSPDGSSILIGSNDGKARLFERKAGGKWDKKPDWTSAEGTGLTSVAFSPDGRSFITGAGGGQVKAQVFEKGRDGKWGLEPAWTSGVLKERVGPVAFSPDGSLMLLGSGATAQLFEKQADGRWRQEPSWTTNKHRGFVRSVAFSADGRDIFIGHVGGVLVYKTQNLIVADDRSGVLVDSGREIKLADLSGMVETVAQPRKPWPQALAKAQLEFGRAGSENERQAARAKLQELLETSVIPWQATGREELKELDVARGMVFSRDHDRGATTFAVSRDGQLMLAVGLDGDARLFEKQPDGTWSKDALWTSKDTLLPEGSGGPKAAGLGQIQSVAMSSDGRSFLISGFIWGGARKNFLFEKNADGEWGLTPAWVSVATNDFSVFAFSPDGRSFVVGGGGQFVEFYEKQADGIWPQAGKWSPGQAGAITSLEISPDGQSLLVGGGTQIHLLQRSSEGRWDLKPVWTIPGDGSAMAFSPDGRSIVIGGNDLKVRLFEKSDDGQWGQEPAWTQSNQAAHIEFSPDGLAVLISGKGAGLFKKQADGTWSQKPAWTSRNQGPLRAAFSPDGRAIITGDRSGVGIYQNEDFIIADDQTGVLLRSGQKIPLADLPEEVETVAQPRKPWVQTLAQAQLEFSRAAGRKEREQARSRLRDVLKTPAIPWKAAAREELRELDVVRAPRVLGQVLDQAGEVRTIAYSRDGRYLLTQSKDGKARLFRKQPDGTWNQDAIWTSPDGSSAESVAFSPDSRSFLVGSSDGKTRLFEEQTGGVWGQESWTSAAHGKKVLQLAFSPDGRSFVAGGNDGKVRVFEKAGGTWGQEPVWSSAKKGDWIEALAFGGDGRSFVADHAGSGRVQAYEKQGDGTWGQKDLAGPFGISYLTLSPDGGLLLIGDINGDISLFAKTAEGQWGQAPSWTFKDPKGGWVGDLAFSPDGASFLARASETVLLFEKNIDGTWGKEPAWTAQAPEYKHGSAAFSADGREILMGGNSGLAVYATEDISIADEQAGVVLRSGRKIALAELPERVQTVAVPAASARDAFPARYGDKGRFFAADDSGRVHLNFHGRWYATGHRLRPGVDLSAREGVEGFVGARRQRLNALELSDLVHPYAGRPLAESDFLLETRSLAKVEDSALRAFQQGWAVDFVGDPGAGKTSIARELALLLGLPRFTFQMHGERELSDLIGSYREDERGRMRLSSKLWRDKDGRSRFKPPLLDMIANGGVYTLDEGAVGERGRELLSWFSGLVNGDKTITLEEFPGQEIRLTVHPDFHLVITNNDPEKTAGRASVKSEIGAHVHAIFVPEDDEAPELARLFSYFLGDAAVPADKKAAWGRALAALHHELKPAVGKEVGKDAQERYYLSKREVRRVAGQVRRHLRRHPGEPGDYAFYRATRGVYEAMFSHEKERAWVLERIRAAMRPEIGETAALEKRLEEESLSLSPAAATEHEARVGALTRQLFEQGEPVLYLTERGARGDAMLKAAARGISARIEPLDAAPEQGELEILGGLMPRFGSRAEGSARSHRVRGRLSRHLVTREELDRLSKESGGPQPVVLWLRNIDQWKEEVRTALNGLLEDGYLELEGSDGRPQRLFLPPHVHLLAEMPADSTQEFSSAFFNRWVKIGVSQDSTRRPADSLPSDFEKVLQASYGLDPLEAFYVSQLYRSLQRLDQERLWSNRKDYQMGPTLFFTLAQALRASRREDSRWQAPLAPKQYRALVAESVAREARNLIGSRLYRDAGERQVPDSGKFEDALKNVLGASIMPRSAATLATRDGTMGSELEAVDGIAVTRTAKAIGVGEASRRTGVRLTPQILSALAVLARADSLGKVVALEGETGGGKTSIGALWAQLTGRVFYKYQSHGGSELADVTMDIEQSEDGEFHRRVKDFYRLLREGNVVIALDEANVAPWLLWVLEPILRGERVVHPVFPGEEPFTLGEGVTIFLPHNSARYSGRGVIDPRLLESMIVARMGLADAQQTARIVESFYGVWEEPRVAASIASAPAEKGAPKAAALFKGKGLVSRAKGDRTMAKGQEVFDENEVPPAPKTAGPKEAVQGIFSPELYPHTRHESFDGYDESSGEFVRDGQGMRVITPPRSTPGQVEAAAREIGRTHDIFEGRYRTHLGRDWAVLPSAGADMEFLEVRAFDPNGGILDIPLEVAKDRADNYYIRGKAPAEIELRYRVAVPAAYYGQPVPHGLAFQYPAEIPSEVRDALAAIGLKGDEADFRTVLYRMVEFFRDFANKENGIPETGRSVYCDLVLGRAGVCRHRAFAFARTALALGIPARYVVSDVHAYAEVEIPDLGWMRVDLGGGGDPMTMDLAPLANAPHEARRGDDFPEPARYREEAKKFGERMEQALKRQGVTPQQANQGGGGGRGGGESGSSQDARRIAGGLEKIERQAREDAQINDELAPLFASGKGDTEFVFNRMLRAMRDQVRIYKQKMKRGLEIDPVAFMLKQAKQFVRRKKEERLQTTALSLLLDFSGSMESVKSQLAYTIAAVGDNFWKLRETAPEHFFYDLSWFTESSQTVIAMGERVSAADNAKRLVAMANSAGKGGTQIVPALKDKLKDFLGWRQASSAKVKYLILVTDGADSGAVTESNGRAEVTAGLDAVLSQYRQAGIAVIAVGIGAGAKDVRAFHGPGRHFVRIDAGRSEDIAEAVAKISELQSKGAGRLPQGELNAVLNIPAPAD